MIFSKSILAFASSMAIANALAASPSPTAGFVVPCQAVLASPKPTAHCGAQGRLGQASVTRSRSGLTQSQCASWCLNNKSCKSFSYSVSGGVCQQLRKPLSAQGLLFGKSGTRFWSAHCYSLQCPSSPSVTALPDSPQQSTRPAASLPTTTPTSVFQPPIPTDYSSCIAADPSNPDLTFKLINPSDGIPIVNNGGKAQKATQIVDPIPQYQFSPVDGVPGQYDLMLDGQYLGLTIDGESIFTQQSSGLDYVNCGGILCITSLFSYGCDGTLSTGIPGVVPYDFGTLDGDSTGQLYGQPDFSQWVPAPDGSTSRLKRSLSPETRARVAQAEVRTSLRAMTFVPAPQQQFNVPSSASTSRCPNTPSGLLAVVRNGARPPGFNGCGPSGFVGKLVPNYYFEQCCDNHDLCFDDCSQGFNTCNQNFGNCNRQACVNQYSGDFLADIEIWGCDQIADFYQDAVSGNLGAGAFTDANNDRCTCQCPVGQDVCNGGNHCQDLLSDANNCGSCGNSCPSGECDNGQCYVPPPPPPPVVSNDPCDSNNWLNFPGSAQPAANHPAWSPFGAFGNQIPAVTGQGMDLGLYGGGTYMSKADCCHMCQNTPGCAFYAVGSDINSGSSCRLGIVNSNAHGTLSPPKPNQCPLGGINTGLSPNRGDVGTGSTGSSIFGQSVEPGPCDTNFCCN